jgi:ATP-dependent protease ClpP protease subunit
MSEHLTLLIANPVNLELYEYLSERFQEHQLNAAGIRKIEILVASFGGSFHWGTQIYYLLRRLSNDLKIEVNTYAVAEVKSAANYLFLAGDRRIAVDGVAMMQHAITAWEGGPNAEQLRRKLLEPLHPVLLAAIEGFITNLEEGEKAGLEIYRRSGVQDPSLLESFFTSERFFGAKEALDWGVATEIGLVPEDAKNRLVPIFGYGPHQYFPQLTMQTGR